MKRPGSQGPLVHTHGGDQTEEIDGSREREKIGTQGWTEKEKGGGRGPTSMLHINSSRCDPM